MHRPQIRLFVCVTVACLWALSGGTALAQTAGEGKLPDLSEFRTVETAITTKISLAAPSVAVKIPGYLGMHMMTNAQGKIIVADVEEGSPAAKAGLQKGDVVEKVGKNLVKDLDALRDVILGKGAGDELSLAIVRKDTPMQVKAKLEPTSKPASASSVQKAVMGVTLEDAPEGVKGVALGLVTPGLPADLAGLKKGDVVIKVDGKETTSVTQFQDLVGSKLPGDTVQLDVKRDNKDLQFKVKLIASTGGGKPGFGSGSFDNRFLTLWKKDVYRLAVVCIEYPDTKHNPTITSKHWQDALFSTGTYTGKSVTGQKVFGSLNDYYQEQSFGKLRLEGKVFDYVQVSKERMKYATGSKTALFNEALDLLLQRDGKDALDKFDGIFFMYAGARAKVEKGGIYWPHRSTTTYKNKKWAYFICPEGGNNIYSISVIAHEFGHMLGLPDLYDNANGTINGEGLGVWCTMSVGHGQDGKPLHFSAFCKEKLGWISPAVIDPTVKQKLILGAIANSPKECYKVLVRPDGSEYLLLENRIKKGFDGNLPAEGLLVWRVVNNKPVLQESHGITTPMGPKMFLNMVPFPSQANKAFTPHTTPTSTSPQGGGLPVWITNIKRLPDGRVTFYVGYEYL
jgi:M6 family metalloprotease-like protein